MVFMSESDRALVSLAIKLVTVPNLCPGSLTLVFKKPTAPQGLIIYLNSGTTVGQFNAGTFIFPVFYINLSRTILSVLSLRIEPAMRSAEMMV